MSASTTSSNSKPTKKRKSAEQTEKLVVVQEVEEKQTEEGATVAKSAPKLAKKDQMVIGVKMQYGAALISVLLQQMEHQKNAELEVRLGEVINGVFRSGVAREFYSQMFQLVVAASNNIAAAAATTEQNYATQYTMIFYYSGQVRGIQKLDAEKKTKVGKMRYEVGGRLAKLDFVHAESCGLHALRVNVKREVELTGNALDEFFAAGPKLESVRIKATCSVLHQNSRFDFTEAWLAKTEDQVMKLYLAQANDPSPLAHTYEIELEAITKSVCPQAFFQQAVQLLGVGPTGALHLSPLLLGSENSNSNSMSDES